MTIRAIPQSGSTIEPSDFESYFYHLGTYVVDGLNVSAGQSGSTISVNIAQGQCKVGGILVKVTATEEVTVTANRGAGNPNYIYFELQRNDAENEITGVTAGSELAKDDSDTDKIYIAKVATSAAAVVNPIIRETYPTLSMVDYQGKRLLEMEAVNNAANSLHVVNAVANSPVVISARGSSGNVGISIAPQGTGIITVNSAKLQNTDTVQMKQVAMNSNNIDFDSTQYQTRTMQGDTTFTSSNRGNGKSRVIRLVNAKNPAGSLVLTFPAAWKFLGAKPPNIAASKTAVLTLSCFGNAEADVVAGYAVER